MYLLPAPRPMFEDLNGYDVNFYYPVTNEDPKIHRKALDGEKLRRVGCISSGGEIPLTVFLPIHDGPVVAVDHSYKALATTMLKAIMLSSLGARGLKNVLAEGLVSYKEAEGIAIHGLREIYPILARKLEESSHLWPGSMDGGKFDHLRHCWCNVSDDLLEAARGRLSNLVLVHGDLQDLRRYSLPGKFDCLYLSNACEHSGRNGAPHYDAFAGLVTEDAIILATSTYTLTPSAASAWDGVMLKKGPLTGGWTGEWNYWKYRRRPIQLPAPTIPVKHSIRRL